MNNVIVVTGGGGFIGHHLVKKLLLRSKVVVLDNFSRGSSRRLDGISEDLIIEDCDITSYQSISKCLKNYNVKVLYHLAAINGTGNFYNIPIQIMDVGVLGCYNILKYSAEKNIEKIIIASSAEVYQEAKIIPTPEDIPLIVPDVKNPRYSYALSKIYTEYYSFQFAVKHNLNVSVFRPHNVYGPDMGLQHVIPQFIMEFLKNSENDIAKINVKGSLDSIRSFCYVEDIINGLEILEKHNEEANVYNIGDTVKISMKDLLNKISELTEQPYSLNKDIKNSHAGGAKLRCPDIKKIQSLGYNCQTSLDVGLKNTIIWYQDNFEKMSAIVNKTF